MKLSELKQRLGAFQLYVIVILVIAVCLYVGFRLGNTHYNQQTQLVAKYQQSVKNLKAENHQLTKSLNILGVELEVANIAENKAFEQIQQSMQREDELRQKLSFYQQVMAPELNPEGFLIDGFNLEPSASDNSYRFELVLIQQKKIKQSLTGDLKITLIGSENSEPKQYPLSALLANPKQQPFKFGFKYFQVIQGELTLPVDFVPEKVSVYAAIYQNRRKKGQLTTVFDWLITES